MVPLRLALDVLLLLDSVNARQTQMTTLNTAEFRAFFELVPIKRTCWH
jgi:hypothetical protein